MKLISNAFNQALQAGKRYQTMKSRFLEFFKAGQYLAEPAAGLQNLSFEENFDRDYFDVLYSGIRLRFEFTVLVKEDNSVSGTIYCPKENPRFTESKVILGVISFNGQGVTDFEPPIGEDPVTLQYNAIEILTHFICLAFQKPLET
jgi:hypothetical protein